MALEETDQETFKDVYEKTGELRRDLRSIELRQMLKEENDDKNAIVSINAGAGGTEAQDWTEMLVRMYLRWCERKSFAVQIVDLLEGEEAGIKNTTFTVSGAQCLWTVQGRIGHSPAG